MKDLKQKAIRGGVAKVSAQVVSFTLRLGSLMILARLLDPKDFGLVGMVTAFSGVLDLFRDFGLSAATVQQVNVTDEQVSSLFWINILVGVFLFLTLSLAAPIIVSLYHEPRLFWVTIVLATGFLFNAAGIQHSAMLQRQLRFTALAGIEVLSLAVSISVGIGLAAAGFSYWALVAMTVTQPLVTAPCFWKATAWIPGKPSKKAPIRSLIRFGGTVTLNSLVVYVAYNLEKVLLGRFWGAEALGIYGRSYQLINMPTVSLNSAAGEVAFPALSRVQSEPDRLRNYFLKGYALVLAVTIPITIAVALFANDIILVLLGPKWNESAAIFRLLAPTILIFAMINPLAWLLLSLGLVKRSLQVALVLAPVVMTAYIVGLPYGPKGVAFVYSAALVLWVIPHIAWCVHGTVISIRDIVVSASRPLLSGLAAATIAFGAYHICLPLMGAIARLIIGCLVLASVYLFILLFVMKQKALYVELLQGFRKSSSVKEEALAPIPN